MATDSENRQPIPPDHREALLSNYHLAKANLEGNGQLRPTAMFKRGDKISFMLAETEFDESGKDEFAAQVRLAAICTEAQIVTFMSEAWAVRLNTQELMDEFEEYRRTHDSFEFFRGRIEVVISHVESYEGITSAQFVIVREDEKAPTLEPLNEEDEWCSFVPREKINKQLRGRFVDFLPPKAMMEMPSFVEAARRISKRTGAVYVPLDDATLDAIKRGERPWERVLQ